MPVARMKPSSPRVSSPSPPAHKLELQTLKLEELTVSLVCSVPELALLLRAGTRPHKLKASALGKSIWIAVPPLDFLVIPPQSSLSTSSPYPLLRSRSLGSSCACGDSRCPGPKRCSWSACVVAPRQRTGRNPGARTKRPLHPGRASSPRLRELPGRPAR